MSAIDRLIAAAIDRARSLRTLARAIDNPLVKGAHQRESARWSEMADHATKEFKELTSATCTNRGEVT